MHRTFQRPFRTILAIVMRAVTIFSLEDTLTVKMLVNNKEKPYQRYSACIFFLFSFWLLALTIIWFINTGINSAGISPNLIKRTVRNYRSRIKASFFFFSFVIGTLFGKLLWKPPQNHNLRNSCSRRLRFYNANWLIFRGTLCKNGSITVLRAWK